MASKKFLNTKNITVSLLKLFIFIVINVLFLLLINNKVNADDYYELPIEEKSCPESYYSELFGAGNNRCCIEPSYLSDRITGFTGDITTHIEDELGLVCDETDYRNFNFNDIRWADDKTGWDPFNGGLTCKYKMARGSDLIECRSGKNCLGCPKTEAIVDTRNICLGDECRSIMNVGSSGGNIVNVDVCVYNCKQEPQAPKKWCYNGTLQQYEPVSCSPSNNGGGGTNIDPQQTCGEMCYGEHDDHDMYWACMNCICQDSNATSTYFTGNVWTEIGCITPTQEGVTIAVMRVFFGIVTGFAVVRFIQAGIMLNTDDPEKIKEGKSIALSALAAIVMAGILPVLMNFVGIEIFDIGELFTFL